MADSPVWIKVTAYLEHEPVDWSIWAELFERHGICGTIQTDDPLTMGAYLAPGTEEMLDELKDSLLSHGASKVTTEQVPEEDWAESWKQFFKPVRIGDRFVVRPTWEAFEIGPQDIEIVLDPGQAFGTGDHPTTRMCLELLERHVEKTSIVADIGCGSGILSIAAMKLGAKSTIGVDLDRPSIEASKANSERNNVVVEVLEGKGFDPLPSEATFDVVVSNIISAALISLAAETSQRVRQSGVWIVSGIIDANWSDVKAKAESVGFDLLEKRSQNEWVAAVFRR